MKLVTAQIVSSAPPSAFFAKWADMATWPEWNADTEWVRLDGPFVEGATGKLKPKGGPVVPFVVQKLVAGREFVDVSTLLGARLTFDHQVAVEPQGTVVTVTVTLTGPLARVWNLILGKGIRTTADRDLAALAEAAAQVPAA
ncbi:SRPBCC family protein [Spongisporangium articulatum]|uniref:SRPBCC family protein n=1 Tax=Spongisporangium articulatum TaxID=3362603 RepID=A0ABW8AKF0_9ACTN